MTWLISKALANEASHGEHVNGEGHSIGHGEGHNASHAGHASGQQNTSPVSNTHDSSPVIYNVETGEPLAQENGSEAEAVISDHSHDDVQSAAEAAATDGVVAHTDHDALVSQGETHAEIHDATHEAAAHAHKNPGILGDTYTWLIVAFAILMGLVYKAGGFKAMMKGLDDKADKIRQELEEAETLRREAQDILGQYRRRYRDALQESQDIIDHAKKETMRLREEAEKDLEATVERRKQQALERIAQAEAKALAEVRAEAVDIAMKTSASLLSADLGEGADAKLIDAAMKDLPNKLN